MIGMYFVIFAVLATFSYAAFKDEGMAVRQFINLLKERVGNDADFAVNALKEESFTQVLNKINF